MRGRRSTLVLALVVAAAAPAEKSNACPSCTCGMRGDNPLDQARAHAEGADVIFLATAIEIRTESGVHCPRVRGCEVRTGDRTRFFEDVIVRFDVETVWKTSVALLSEADSKPTIEIVTNVQESACGYDFEAGGDYLVYGWLQEETGVLRTGLCSGNHPRAAAAFDLGVLGEPLVRFR